jgi:hypothetical protein
MPGPINQVLYDNNEKTAAVDRIVALYPNSLAVLRSAAPQSDDDTVSPGDLIIRPARGRFAHAGSPPLGSPPGELCTTYHFGFSSDIGAGPYDRRLGRQAPPTPDPSRQISGGGSALTGASAVPAVGTLTILDSLTYAGAINLNVSGKLTIRAENKQRPLIRLPLPPNGGVAEWIIGGNAGSALVLDGLYISGGDIVIRGDFQELTITCCTIDPGNAANSLGSSPPPGSFAISADGRELSPTRIWIEGSVNTLTIERTITGAIQSRRGGTIQTLNVTDSILQAIPGTVGSPPQSPLSPPDNAGDAAIALDDGDVCLSRCTVLGRVLVHRLRASECILDDVATIDDTQHGCVRFTAWSQGSVLPKKYESVAIAPRSALFTSTDFGQPGYCQLLPTADAAIVPDFSGATQNTISAGSQDGSEMGAFARERSPLKARGLLIKYQEFMPVGLVPVLVYVT